MTEKNPKQFNQQSDINLKKISETFKTIID